VPNLVGEIGEPTWWHDELDYVAPEVTARYFTATPALRRVEVGQGRVEHVEDDVTVRSVTPKQRDCAAGPVGWKRNATGGPVVASAWEVGATDESLYGVGTTARV
jgi:hypothetical protein